MSLLSHAVVLSCRNCWIGMAKECVLEVDDVGEYMCRNYIPGVRIDPNPNYQGEFET